MRLHTSLIALFIALSPVAIIPGLAHDTGAHATEASSITVGDIVISGSFSRATLPNAPVGGGFLTITNTGDQDDVLVSAGAPIAAETQLHEMSMEGDVMKMRQLTDGIPLPAGQSVTLEPGGLHIMFMGLTGPLVEGQTIPVTLTFQKAGTVTFDMSVGGSAADEPAHGDMNHGAASSDWAQAGMGGRALLRKTTKGWGIHLCSGAGLRDAAELIKIGVPYDLAVDLAAQLGAAESGLPAEAVALYDSFDGTMMVDGELI